jgi:hypothetical protein
MLFVFAVVLLIGAFLTNQILGGLGDPLGINSAFTKFYTALNNVSIFIFIGMSFGAVLAALLIRAHPAFFFIAIILVIVEFMIIPPLVNAYNTVADNPQFAVEKAAMAQNVQLMQNLPLWTAIAALLAALVGIGKGD